MPEIHCSQPLKYNYFLVFLHFYYFKVNIFGIWTVCQTNQAFVLTFFTIVWYFISQMMNQWVEKIICSLNDNEIIISCSPSFKFDTWIQSLTVDHQFDYFICDFAYWILQFCDFTHIALNSACINTYKYKHCNRWVQKSYDR